MASSDPTTCCRTSSSSRRDPRLAPHVEARAASISASVPEQNFTYIAALKPKMAFIIDIRRGNLQLHLMYKALFELSSDRADFIFRLFSRKRPEGTELPSRRPTRSSPPSTRRRGREGRGGSVLQAEPQAHSRSP